jgi:hypothetical protein
MLIEGGKVKWASRPGWFATLRAFSHDRFILSGVSDERHKGTLKDGSLVWDDGDVWVPHKQAGRTMLPRPAPRMQAAEQAIGTREADSTAMTMEDIFDQQTKELMADIGDLAMEVPSGQTPVLKDLVGRLVHKHGDSARPRDIISRLRNLPALEEQLDKGSFKAPLYSLGVMTDTPLNLNGLFAELSGGDPPTCSMSMLIEAIHARWPIVDGRGSEYSSEFGPEASRSASSSRSASVSSASSAGRGPRRPGPQASLAPAKQPAPLTPANLLALQERAQARPAEDAEDDAYSDDDFEAEEAGPSQHLEEPSATLQATKLAGQAASRSPSTRTSATCLKNNEVDEHEYDDSDFEDDDAGPAVPGESDDDVLDGSDQDVLDESDDEGGHRPAQTSSSTVPGTSNDERGHPLTQAALAAVPDEVGSAGSEGDQDRSDVESVA